MSGAYQVPSVIHNLTRKCWRNLTDAGIGYEHFQNWAAGESRARIRATLPGETMRFAVTLTTWRHRSLSRE
jgi:hypothetical protein